MYLVYQPEGSEEPQRWKYNPKRGLLTPEREAIERYTGRNYAEFTQDVVKGNSLCRRALLFVFLKRDHPKLRFDDVAFEWEELTLEYSKGELTQMREQAAETVPAEQKQAVLDSLDEQIAQAYEDPDEQGKASLPVAD